MTLRDDPREAPPAASIFLRPVVNIGEARRELRPRQDAQRPPLSPTTALVTTIVEALFMAKPKLGDELLRCLREHARSVAEAAGADGPEAQACRTALDIALDIQAMVTIRTMGDAR